MGSFLTILQHITHLLQGLNLYLSTRNPHQNVKFNESVRKGFRAQMINPMTGQNWSTFSTSPYQSEPVCWVVSCLLRWHRYVYCHRIMNGDSQFSVKQVQLPVWTFLCCVGYDCSIWTFSSVFPLANILDMSKNRFIISLLLLLLT
jgi:hypothetical protein